MADTIKLMRQRVLDMAIRGELVEQRPEEGIADVTLLEQRSLKSGKSEASVYLTKEFESFSRINKIPKSWTWTTLDHITNNKTLRNGDWILSENMSEKEEVKLIQLGSIGYGEFIKKNFKHISFQTFKELNCTEITTGDLLINRLIGDKMFVTLLPNIDGKKITSVDVCIIKPNHRLYDSRYMLYMMMSSLFQEQVMKNSSGTTRKRISKNNLVKLFIPFPPIAEQKRIVAKIEEIFAVIDQIGERKEEALTIIRNMRQTAIQNAIMGLLVEQDESDEPASVLYEKIQAEKEQLVKEKKIKKERTLPEIEEDEIPFEIPRTWKWVRLGDVGNWGAGATPSRSNPSYWVGGTIPWLKTGELNNGYIYSAEEYITETAVKETSVRMNQPNDILIAMYGATIGKLGILQFESTTNQACCACTPFSGMFNRYLFYFLMSNKEKFIKSSEGGAQPNISRTKIVNTVAPLPPFAEQVRIVEKIDEIMAICDQMEGIFDGSSGADVALKVVQ